MRIVFRPTVISLAALAMTACQSLRADTPSASEGNLDQHIAACLLLGNQEEIAIAEFAQERASSPQVKQFAQTMVEQHQQAIEKIKQAAPQLASLNVKLQATAGSATPGREGATPRADEPGRTGSEPGATTAGQGVANSPMFALARDAAQECLNLTTKELSEKQGAEFDKAYMGQQCGAHIAMLAKLRASKRHATDQLQPVLAEGIQMTEHHLAEAKKIKQGLKDAPAARVSARPAGAERAPQP
jgi:predicted outer membrane protein